MTEYFVEIIFENVDLADGDIDRGLERADVAGADTLEGNLARLGTSLEASDAFTAAQNFIQKVRSEIPDAMPVRAARDLVNTSEIADRIGTSRQAVHNWSNGERRDGSFPHPMDVVGNQKIWEWGAVNAWLRFNLGLDDGLFYPTPLELGEIDAYIKYIRTRSNELSFDPFVCDLGAKVQSSFSTSYWKPVSKANHYILTTAHSRVEDYVGIFDAFPKSITIPLQIDESKVASSWENSLRLMTQMNSGLKDFPEPREASPEPLDITSQEQELDNNNEYALRQKVVA